MKLLGLVLLTTLAVAAEPPCLWVRGLPAGAGGRIVSAPVDLDAVAACSTPPVAVDVAGLAAGVRVGETWQAVPLQFDAAAGSRVGEVTLRLPDTWAGEPVAVFLRDAPVRPAAAPAAALTVQREGAAVTITNATYAVRHDPAKLGGLPSRIELRPAGKVCDTYALNDRVYDAKLGGFSLRSDPQPKVELVAAGPLRVVVRVTARYLNDRGEAPPSQPTAAYTFSYVAGSPLVELNADTRQAAAFNWGELHLWELNFADQTFPGWLGGPPRVEGTFKAEKKGWQHVWGGLRAGEALIGLLAAGGVRFYDGRGEYGTYLHGPWTTWMSTATQQRATLFLSGAPGSDQAFEKAAVGPKNTLPWLLPSVTADRIAALRTRLAGQPASVAGRSRWWLTLATSLARRGAWRQAQTLLEELDSELATRRTTPARLDRVFEQHTGWTTLTSDALCCAFDGPVLASLYDPAADRELLSVPAPLWRAELRDADKKLHPWGPEAGATARVEREPGGLALRFSGGPLKIEGRTLTAPAITLHVAVHGPRLSLRTAVDGAANLSLWRIECPILPLGTLGDDGSDDVYLYPGGPGIAQPDPVGTGVSWGGRYPDGWHTMQFQAVYDGLSGVYLAAEDPEASVKEPFGRGPDGRGVVEYGFNWPAPNAGVAGNRWQQPGAGVIEVFHGDWFDAAQIYRRWAEREARWWPARARAKTTPRDVREIAVWAQTGATPYEPDKVVARTIEFAKYMGVPTALHWYSWHQIPFDTFYPHYDPPRPRVAEGVAELQRAGVKVMPYINGRLFDTELDDFKSTAVKYAAKQESGEPWTEMYGSKRPDGSPVKLAAMCPATGYWQDKQQQIVLWLQNTVGVDGVYMDQIAAAAPALCFDPTHGHPLAGGSWWTVDGYWPLLTKLRAAMKPGKFLTTECNAEPYLHLMDGYLTWHWQYNHMVPAFSAVYADQVVLFSRNFGGGKDRDLAAKMKFSQALNFGEQLGWLTPDCIQWPCAPYLRQCAQLRHALRDYLAYGRMLRPVKLSGDVPAITADWQWYGNSPPVTLPAVLTSTWRAVDGRVVVLLANYTTQPATVTCGYDAAELGVAPAAPVTARTAAGAFDVKSWPRVALPAETVVAVELKPR